jgi:hypothetical protein
MTAVNSAVPGATGTSYAWSDAAVLPQDQLDPGVGTLWPGAITTDHGNDAEWEQHGVAVPAEAQPDGRPSPDSVNANPFNGTVENDEVEGGGYVPAGEAWEDHDVAYPAWDSNAGAPFATAGAVSVIHNYGGGSDPGFLSTPQDIGQPKDLYIASQSYAPTYTWDPTTGNRDNAATQWVAHDQVPDWNGSAYDYRPRFYDNEVNAVSPNLASVGQPIMFQGDEYGVSGGTPDYSDHYDQHSELYAPPGDPQVVQAPTVTAPYNEEIDGVI